MINLNNFPRTDAEALAAARLYHAAKIGRELYEVFNAGLTSDANYFFAETQEFAAKNGLNKLREEIIDEHTTLCKICRKYEARLREDFMHVIDDYNEAVAEVEADPRSRDEILISDGWQRDKDGRWMRRIGDGGDSA